MDATNLRKTLRTRRAELTSEQQQHARKKLAARMTEHPAFQQSQHIALYLANDGEIDPSGIADIIWQQGKVCYLPVLDPTHKGYLYFLPYTPDTPMVNNAYGIAEPLANATLARTGDSLELVLLPLTGFDAMGNRMGMGGGYYDRTFAFKQTATKKKPILIGLAHECQKVSQLKTNHWDIPMDGIATDTHFYPYNTG